MSAIAFTGLLRLCSTPLPVLLRSSVDSTFRHENANTHSLLYACISPKTGGLCGEVDRDVLGLQVLFDAFVTALAAEARLLYPAKRCGSVRDHTLVEADHARLEPLDHAERALEIIRVDVGNEAVLRIVGRGDRLLLGVEREDRGHGTEDLLLAKVGFLGHVVEHGRLVEVAVTFDLVGANERFRALAERVFDEFRDLATLVFVDERSDFGALLR